MGRRSIDIIENCLSCLLSRISCDFTFLVYRLTKAKDMDYAFRYAMPTVIVVWSCIETLVKWKIFSEPWITLNPVFLSIIIVAFIFAIYLIFKTEKRKEL